MNITKKAKWEVVVPNIFMEGSFGSYGHTKNVRMSIEVGIDPIAERGYFEMYDVKSGGERWYAEGGLWFSGNTLKDYDGVCSLSSYILDKLKEWGIVIDDFIEDDEVEYIEVN